MGWDGMVPLYHACGCPGIGWDGMGWDWSHCTVQCGCPGIGWGGMGWDVHNHRVKGYV